jgi:membrane-associated protein
VHALLADLATPLALMPEWLSPRHIFEEYGLIAIVAIIFAETGLLIGFFLPGDTLLFSAGILAKLNPNGDPLWLMLTAVPIAAIAGNLVGYEIGRRAGPAIFTRDDSRFFRKEHLVRSHAFFERYGPLTIFLARFVPIVRTFAAVVAGAVQMEYRKFVIWSILGAVAWCTGLILVGYGAASLLPRSTAEWIEGHIDLLIIGVVLVTVASVVFEGFHGKHRREKAAAAGADAGQATADVITGAAPGPEAVDPATGEPREAAGRAD